jgi:hypothetical protein
VRRDVGVVGEPAVARDVVDQVAAACGRQGGAGTAVDVAGQVRIVQPKQRLDPCRGTDYRSTAPGRGYRDRRGVTEHPGVGDLGGECLPVVGSDRADRQRREAGEEAGIGIPRPPARDRWARAAVDGQLDRGEFGGVVDERQHLGGKLACLVAVVGQPGGKQQVSQAAHPDTDLALGAHHLR